MPSHQIHKVNILDYMLTAFWSQTLRYCAKHPITVCHSWQARHHSSNSLQTCPFVHVNMISFCSQSKVYSLLKTGALLWLKSSLHCYRAAGSFDSSPFEFHPNCAVELRFLHGMQNSSMDWFSCLETGKEQWSAVCTSRRLVRGHRALHWSS